MTREEAKTRLIAMKGKFEILLSMRGLEMSDVFDVAIEALSAEPCEDAVSRQAMHMELEKWITYGEYKYSNAMRYLFDRIDRLPAVTPICSENQNKCGTWRHYEGMLYCSGCGAEFYDEIMEHTGDEVPKHCPDCGADMRAKETDFDYERAIDQLEHDILYEHTFNQDDGSM